MTAPKIFTNKINQVEQDKIQEMIRSTQAEAFKVEQAIQKRNVSLRKLEDEKMGIDNEIKVCSEKKQHRGKLESRVAALKRHAASIEQEKTDVNVLKERSIKESYVSRETAWINVWVAYFKSTNVKNILSWGFINNYETLASY